MLLVNIGNLHSLTYLYTSAVRLLKAHNQTEKSGLSCAVGSDNAHYACRRQHKVKMFEKKFVPIGFAHIVELYNLVAEMRSVRDIDLKI